MSNDCYVASSCIANETKLVFQLTSRPHQSKLDHVKKKGNKNKEEEEVIGKTGHLAHSPGNKRTWKGEWGWGGGGKRKGGHVRRQTQTHDLSVSIAVSSPLTCRRDLSDRPQLSAQHVQKRHV